MKEEFDLKTMIKIVIEELESVLETLDSINSEYFEYRDYLDSELNHLESIIMLLKRIYEKI